MTVEEILRQSGLSDEQIKALDAKVLSGFTTVLTTAAGAQTEAQKAKDAAELAQRAQRDMYDQQIAPALDGWANEKATIAAERDYYKTLAEKAKEGGFAPPETPPFKPAQGADGKFVANQNEVPGSPKYMTLDQGLAALTNANWVLAEHMRLYGTPYPDDFQALLQESTNAHLPFRDYASKKYKFDDKRAEIAAAEQKKRDDTIRAEAVADNDKKWAERVGNNPMVRQPAASQFGTVAKAVQEGTRKDPLTMSKAERHQYTQQQVQSEIAKNETVQ